MFIFKSVVKFTNEVADYSLLIFLPLFKAKRKCYEPIDCANITFRQTWNDKAVGKQDSFVAQGFIHLFGRDVWKKRL